MRRVVVNADDLGMGPGANAGIALAHREGIVTSTSLIVTTPYYREALREVVSRCPALSVGIHFSLTAGRAVSPPGSVGLLARRDGKFRHGFTGLLLLALLPGRVRRRLARQVWRELDAQARRAQGDGVHLTHADSERHVHMIPLIFRVAARVLRRRGVGWIRLSRERSLLFPGVRHLLEPVANGNLIKRWLLNLLSWVDAARLDGLRAPDHFFSILYSGKMRREVLSHFLSRAGDGVTEIMVHPGAPSAGEAPLLEDPPLRRYLGRGERREELHACLGMKCAPLGPAVLSRFEDAP